MHIEALTRSTGLAPETTEVWRDPLALLLASTGEGIYGVDLNGLCVFINPAGARLIGYEPDEVRGRNMHGLTHHARSDGTAYPEDLCPIFNAFRRGLPCRIDTEVFWRRDGTAFPVEYSSHPIVAGGDHKGGVRSRVVMARHGPASTWPQNPAEAGHSASEIRPFEQETSFHTELRETIKPPSWWGTAPQKSLDGKSRYRTSRNKKAPFS